jgi:GT2 family glycosyltransferase
MKVGAVVLHYQFWPGVGETLDALFAQTRRPDGVVVVDNQSGDGSTARLRLAFPELDVIEAGSNLGYGGGMNLGIRRLLELGFDAILLLTHECHLAPEALQALIQRMAENPRTGAVGPLLAYRSRPDVVFSAGGEIEGKAWRTSHVNEPPLAVEWADREPREAQWLDGAAMLLRSDAIAGAGAFDESYFLYFEETEYLLQLRRLGWSVECVPAAVAWQEPGSAPPYLMLRNRLRFLARLAPKRHVLWEAGRLAASVGRNSLFPNPRLSADQIRDRRRALLHFLTRRWGPDAPGVEPRTTGTWEGKGAASGDARS